MIVSPSELSARALFAPILVVAAAFLVKGYAATGGGFAAGVVASLGVLLQYFALGFEEAERRLAWVGRAYRLAVAGLVLMAATVLPPVVFGLPPVWHLPAPGEHVTKLGPLELHTALAFETGVALAVSGFVVASVHLIARQSREEVS